MSSRASGLSESLAPSSPWKITDRRRIAGATIVIWAAAAGLLSTMAARPIAVAGALAIGWSHLAGRCGVSHFGALTPRCKVPGQRLRWLNGVVAYVVAGALASSAVGAALGAGGEMLVPSSLRAEAVVVVLLIAVVAAATELRLVPWRLPQPNLQTRRHWGLFPSVVPELLWGFCLGLTFATVFTFSGTWLVLAVPFAVGEPGLGATILLAHWVGRAAPILMGPLLLDHARRTPDLLDEMERARSVFRASNLAGIGLLSLSLTILLQDLAA